MGTPSELALVRMSADSKSPVSERFTVFFVFCLRVFAHVRALGSCRRGYKNVGDCCLRIAREEGVLYFCLVGERKDFLKLGE